MALQVSSDRLRVASLAVDAPPGGGDVFDRHVLNDR
jgi:hypothetical protein